MLIVAFEVANDQPQGLRSARSYYSGLCWRSNATRGHFNVLHPLYSAFWSRIVFSCTTDTVRDHGSPMLHEDLEQLILFAFASKP